MTRPTSFDDSTAAAALATAGSVNGNCVDTGDFELYAYDAAGNSTSLRKRDGSTLTFQYDALNRMILKVVPERAGLAATHTRDVYYGYDLRNAQLYARFDSATGEGVTNAYDAFGRPVSSTLAMDGTSRTIARAYDDANNRLALTHPDGAVFTYANDVLGRLAGVYQGAGLATPLASFAYNAQGLPQSRAEATGSAITYAHDAAGRLTSLADTFNWSPANGTATYAYNPAGQITSRSQSNDGYAWSGAYTVNRPYTTNGLNQYSAAGSATFTYDANGNLTSDGSAMFTYDVENRLVAAGGSRTAALRYDPLGRLYEVVGAATTRFLHDGDALIAEYNLGGTMTARYVHGSNAGADDPLVWYGNGTIYWLHSDHQGSITAIANIDGNLLWLNAYDEYGIPRAGNQGRFQYTGQAWLGDLGMYYYKARIYSPTLGRFLQTDPVGYEDQYNLYAYVGNDPVNYVDPDGTDALWVPNGRGGVTLIIPVNYTGSGATRARVAAIVQRANSIRISNPNYRIQVVATSRPISGVLNRMDLSPGYDKRLCPSTGECTNRQGGNYAHINSSRPQTVAAAAHDTLHFAGIWDVFSDGPPDANGNRTSVIWPGYTESNVMASRTGRELRGSQFEEARRNHSTKQCTLPLGSRVPVCR